MEALREKRGLSLFILPGEFHFNMMSGKAMKELINIAIVKQSESNGRYNNLPLNLSWKEESNKQCSSAAGNR